MWRRVWIVLALCLALVPEVALAGPLEGFTTGFDDLVNPKVEQESFERETVTEEATRDGETPQVPLIAQIKSFIWNGLALTIDGREWIPGTYYYGVPRVILLLIVPIAAVLCFFWWGLRKSWSIIRAAWQKGRARL